MEKFVINDLEIMRFNQFHCTIEQCGFNYRLNDYFSSFEYASYSYLAMDAVRHGVLDYFFSIFFGI